MCPVIFFFYNQRCKYKTDDVVVIIKPLLKE